MILFLANINKQHDCAAHHDEDDTNIDRRLPTKTVFDHGVHEDSESEERSLDGLEETPGPGESF